MTQIKAALRNSNLSGVTLLKSDDIQGMSMIMDSVVILITNIDTFRS